MESTAYIIYEWMNTLYMNAVHEYIIMSPNWFCFFFFFGLTWQINLAWVSFKLLFKLAEQNITYIYTVEHWASKQSANAYGRVKILKQPGNIIVQQKQNVV